MPACSSRAAPTPVRPEPGAFGVRADRRRVPAQGARDGRVRRLAARPPQAGRGAQGVRCRPRPLTSPAPRSPPTTYLRAGLSRRERPRPPEFRRHAAGGRPESNNARLAYSFADAAFHVAWAEIELGWLLRLCERQLAVAAHMHDVLNITPETHAAYGDYRPRVQALARRPEPRPHRRSRVRRLQALARPQLPPPALRRAEEVPAVATPPIRVGSWPRHSCSTNRNTASHCSNVSCDVAARRVEAELAAEPPHLRRRHVPPERCARPPAHRGRTSSRRRRGRRAPPSR